MLKKISASVDDVKQFAETRWQDFRGEITDSNKWIKVGLISVAVYVFAAFLVGIYWSIEPDPFQIREKAINEVDNDETRLVTGVITTSTLLNVVETMLEKRGGYISNDVLLPGLWLDNIPNWEYGVLIQVRDFTKAMREAFSRSQSQSTEDKDLARAEAQFNFDHRSFLLPQTEAEYREGIMHLRSYLVRVSDNTQYNAQFYARADNLRYWLSTVETRLGSLSQRLSASVGQRRVNTDLAGETGARQATNSPQEIIVQTPWSKIDDVFYEARGSSWALIQLLKAIEMDFADVLEKKNARVSIKQIIRELEGTQQSVFSPMILNGSGFGVLANHSLVMASFISRANAAIIDLRELLSQG